MTQRAPAGGGRVYFLTDGEPRIWRDVISELLIVCGVADEAELNAVRQMPLAEAWRMAEEMEARATAAVPPLLNRGMLATIGMEVTVDDSLARQEIGYTNIISFEDGMAEYRAATAGVTAD